MDPRLSRRAFLTLLAGVPVAVVLRSGRTVAAQLRLVRVNHWTAPDHTRLVLDLDGGARFATRLLGAPDPRIVIEIPDAGLAAGVAELDVPVADGLVRGVHAYTTPTSVVVRIDLLRDATFDAFPLAPDGAGGSPRIVVDVRRPMTDDERRAAERETERVRRSGDVVVAIDPGHGGNDPGCSGHGVVEKDVALAVARRVAGLFEGRSRRKPVLTRDRDYFVPLGGRQQVARKYGAQVFVSIHVNSAPSSAARGPEVFFVSLQAAADKAARELVDRENAADLVGGVAPEQVRTPVLDILVDLKQSASMRRSERLGEHMLNRLEEIPGGQGRGLKQGPLAVLKSIDAASILVELGFATNKRDAALMKDGAMQRRYAQQIASGVEDYLATS